VRGEKVMREKRRSPTAAAAAAAAAAARTTRGKDFDTGTVKTKRVR
jgi:hypothetical protein